MNRDDIIRIAKEAGFARTKMHKALEKFAELIAAEEREECAKMCESLNEDFDHAYVSACVDVIRARGLSEQN